MQRLIACVLTFVILCCAGTASAYYDAQLGRWLERDPAGYVDGANLYQYVVGNPLYFVDPLGLYVDRFEANGWRIRHYYSHESMPHGYLYTEKERIGNHLAENEGAFMEQEFRRREGFNRVADGMKTGAAIAEEAIRTASPATDVIAAGAEFVGDPSVATAGGVLLSGLPGKSPSHHIATNKNFVSTLRGGPWSPQFEAMFKKAGMTLDDTLNKMPLPGHKNAAHPEAYHQAIYARLQAATDGLEGEAYEKALRDELDKLRKEIATEGSDLNKMVTKNPCG